MRDRGPAPEKGHLIEEPFLEGDGTRTTVGDALLARLARGSYRADACASVGISGETLRRWVYHGAKARQSLGHEWKLNEREQAYVDFNDKLDKVEADAILNDWHRLGVLADGGIPVVRVTEKVDAKGHVETTTTTFHTLPDASALMWRMERRYPGRFGKRVELSGTVGLADEEKVSRAEALAQEIRAFQAGVETSGQLAAEHLPADG